MVDTYQLVIKADDITVARPSGLREVRPTTPFQIMCKSLAIHLQLTCSSLARTFSFIPLAVSSDAFVALSMLSKACD
jgi:hypothetical protein